MQEMDTTRWAGLMMSYFNERFHRDVWFGPAGAPPLTPNDTLWHLRAQQYYLTAQNVPEEVEKWLSLDRSSHPHLAKWLVINPPINGGESKVFDVLKTYLNLLPELLSMPYHRWKESPGEYQEPLRYLERPEYSAQ